MAQLWLRAPPSRDEGRHIEEQRKATKAAKKAEQRWAAQSGLQKEKLVARLQSRAA